MKTELTRLAIQALATSEFTAFGNALATQDLPVSFDVLADADLAALVAQEIGSSDATKWVTRPHTWNTGLYDVHSTLRPAENLLHLLWQDLRGKLARKLDAVTRQTPLASKGAVLCFFGRARSSTVVEYKRSGGGAVSLRPLATLSEPKGVLELTNLLDGATGEVRNLIKNAVISVDKLVYQRGCIIHVDRQREDVFGPTIDTVILGELVAEWLDSRTQREKVSALEIGPGSGLLTTILASSEQIAELTAVDINKDAVICTLKNLHINDATLVNKYQLIRVRGERFQADKFVAPFDFIVCNPPYIPDEAASPSREVTAYGRSVAGLELCIQILESLPTLLSGHGVLLLMVSSVSEGDLAAFIPDGFEAVAALGSEGRRVPLDVDDVWRKPDWQAQLLRDGRISKDPNGDLWHYLRPLWIRRREVKK